MKDRRDINELIFLVEALVERARGANSIADQDAVDELLVSVGHVLEEIKTIINKE